MDDLLALFNDETPLEELGVDVVGGEQQQADNAANNQSTRSKHHDDNDDDDDFDENDDSDDDDVTGSGRNNNNRQQRQQKNKQQEQLSLSVDVKVDIRMMNRKIAGADLLDLVCCGDNPYYSPATLSSMSLSSLNTSILVEPASIINASTVTGRTNMISVGIVFSNSGTRVSSNSGNAYCAITIGNLYSGPCLSILLFGPAYSQHCRTLQPGKVVAIINPRLIPSSSSKQQSGRRGGGGGKGGNHHHYDTSITFTANDERNILLVGDARDYGICMAKIRGKNDHGQWVANAKRCRRYVDKRHGDYCPDHKNYGKKKNKGSTVSGGAGMMQKLQQDAQAHQGIHNNSRQKSIAFGYNRQMILPQLSRNGGWSNNANPNLKLTLEPVHVHNNNNNTKQTNTCTSSQQSHPMLQRNRNNNNNSTNSILNPPSSRQASTHNNGNNRLQNNTILNPGSATTTISTNAAKRSTMQSTNNNNKNPPRLTSNYNRNNGLSMQNNRILNPHHQQQQSSSMQLQQRQRQRTQTLQQQKSSSIGLGGGGGGGSLKLNSLLNPYTSNQKNKKTAKVTPVGASTATASAKAATSSAPPGYTRNSNWLDEATKEKQQQRHRGSGSSSSRCDPLSNSSNQHHQKMKRSNNKETERRRSVNTVAVGGFDGSVAVPGPSRIFGPTAGAAQQQQNPTPSSSSGLLGAPCTTITAKTKASRLPASLNEEKRRESILSRQREVAQITEEKKRKSLSTGKNRAQVKNMSNKKKSSSTATTILDQSSGTRCRSFFDSVDDTAIDTEKVVAARSRFADEVGAEEYARSRNRVLTLEKEEESKTKAAEARQKKKNTKQQHKQVEGGKDCLIHKEWFCHTCKRAQKFDPFMCRRSGHNVKVRRTIKGGETKGEKRQALSDKDTEDGGLKLGAGLEWTRFSWK